MPLKNTSIKIPPYIKAEVKKRSKNMSKWIIEAIQEKLRRDL